DRAGLDERVEGGIDRLPFVANRDHGFDRPVMIRAPRDPAPRGLSAAVVADPDAILEPIAAVVLALVIAAELALFRPPHVSLMCDVHVKITSHSYACVKVFCPAFPIFFCWASSCCRRSSAARSAPIRRAARALQRQYACGQVL